MSTTTDLTTLKVNMLTEQQYADAISQGQVNPDEIYLTPVTGNSGLTIDDVYPVGAIYMSVNSTDPGTLFAGTTWTRLTDTFLLAAGTTYPADDGTHTTATGGEATHTLQTSEIPANTHGSKTLTGTWRNRRYGTSGAGNANVFTASGIASIDAVTSTAAKINASGTGSNGSYDDVTITATHEHTSVGGGGSHNNMPPYLAVYMWKRTA